MSPDLVVMVEPDSANVRKVMVEEKRMVSKERVSNLVKVLTILFIAQFPVRLFGYLT